MAGWTSRVLSLAFQGEATAGLPGISHIETDLVRPLKHETHLLSRSTRTRCRSLVTVRLSLRSGSQVSPAFLYSVQRTGPVSTSESTFPLNDPWRV